MSSWWLWWCATRCYKPTNEGVGFATAGRGKTRIESFEIQRSSNGKLAPDFPHTTHFIVELHEHGTGDSV